MDNLVTTGSSFLPRLPDNMAQAADNTARLQDHIKLMQDTIDRLSGNNSSLQDNIRELLSYRKLM